LALLRKHTLAAFVVISRVRFRLQVAIKKMKKKFYTWEECMQLREVQVG
jgi:hypothetical protein